MRRLCATAASLVLNTSAPADAAIERRLLRGVLAEALDQQARKRAGLLEQQQHGLPSEPTDPSNEKAAKAYAKALRRAAQMPQLISEVDSAEDALVKLLWSAGERDADLGRVRAEMEAFGLGARLVSFDVEAHARAQWGRPEGFDGLVLESPHGIPILVSPHRFSDELLRRVSRGTDLWFQVAKGRGSRVLLRTSMVRSIARRCRLSFSFRPRLADQSCQRLPVGPSATPADQPPQSSVS